MRKVKDNSKIRVGKTRCRKRGPLTAMISIAIILVFVLGIIFNVFGAYSRIVKDTFWVGVDYVTFERPLERIAWKQLKENIEKSTAEHPYVLATAEDFTALSELYYSGESDYVTDRMDYAIECADIWLDAPFLERVFNKDGEMLEVSRQALNRIMTLAGVWQVTREEKYAVRCRDEIITVCNFVDWHPEHFLDTTEMSMAVSLGYDWLYEYLSQTDKDFIAKTVYEKGILKGNRSKIFSNWWVWSKVNWNTQCYGGIGVACMVFGDRYPDKASKFLSAAFYNMPLHFSSFSPDGFYAEGNSYWEAMTSYLLYFITTSRNLLSEDFGLSTLSGFDKVGYFPLYISAPRGVFNFGDNRNIPLYSPSLHWFAIEYDEPMLSYYQSLSIKEEEYPRESFLSCLWYDPSIPLLTPPELPLSIYMKSDMNEEFVASRSAYCDPNATYAGIKAGYNYTNHGDLDIGSFIFDALGERWVEDLGKASYSLPGYFTGTVGGGRWRTYVKRGEGHNTLIINPGKANEDQYPFARASFTGYESTDEGVLASLDMTDAYIRNGVVSAVRKFEVFDNYKQLRITDTVTLKKPGDIYWFAHTSADIVLSADGKSATLIIDRGEGEIKKVNIHLEEGSDGTFSIMDTLPLLAKPRFEGNKEVEGIKKLAINISEKKEAKIVVVFSPEYD